MSTKNLRKSSTDTIQMAVGAGMTVLGTTVEVGGEEQGTARSGIEAVVEDMEEV